MVLLSFYFVNLSSAVVSVIKDDGPKYKIQQYQYEHLNRKLLSTHPRLTTLLIILVWKWTMSCQFVNLQSYFRQFSRIFCLMFEFKYCDLLWPVWKGEKTMTIITARIRGTTGGVCLLTRGISHPSQGGYPTACVGTPQPTWVPAGQGRYPQPR